MPWMFHNFSRFGFRTLYSESLKKYSFFVHGVTGFRVQPTDYYLQPVFSVSENFTRKRDCFGRRSESQIQFDFLDKFVATMKSKRYFAMSHDARLTYHSYDVYTTYDDLYSNFLLRHHNSGLFNRTILIFFSDHGYRWGGVKKSYQGLVEQRNTFMFLMFPPWFTNLYNVASKNILSNKNKLVTMYDLHETLKDILYQRERLKNDVCENRTEKLMSGKQIPRGISLFLPIPKSRTCNDANIHANFCLCFEKSPIDVNDKLVNIIASVLLSELQALVKPYPMCANLQLKQIHSAWIYKQNPGMQQNMGEPFNESLVEKEEHLVDYSVIINTTPGDVMFKAIYRYQLGSWFVLSSFKRVGDIKRLTKFENEANCIKDLYIKPYCYCKK